MRTLRAFLRFWYDFVVGDDWRLAAGVVAGLAATWVLAHVGGGWWVIAAAIIVLLPLSLWHAIRRRG